MRKGFLYLVFVVVSMLGMMPSLYAQGRMERLLEKGWRYDEEDADCAWLSGGFCFDFALCAVPL